MESKYLLLTPSSEETTLVSDTSRGLDYTTSKIYLKSKKISHQHKALLPMNFINKLKYLSKESLHSRTKKPYEKLYETSPIRKKQKLREARLTPDIMIKKDTFLTRISSRGSMSRPDSAREFRRSNSLVFTESMLKQASDNYAKEKENTSNLLNGMTRRYRKSITESINQVRSKIPKENLFSDLEKNMISKNYGLVSSSSRISSVRRILTSRNRSQRAL